MQKRRSARGKQMMPPTLPAGGDVASLGTNVPRMYQKRSAPIRIDRGRSGEHEQDRHDQGTEPPRLIHRPYLRRDDRLADPQPAVGGSADTMITER